MIAFRTRAWLAQARSALQGTTCEPLHPSADTQSIKLHHHHMHLLCNMTKQNTGSSSKSQGPTFKANASFYAVAHGKKPGIYATWAQCQDQVSGVPKAKYKRFDTQEDAQTFINGASGDSPISSVVSSSTQKTKKERFYAVKFAPGKTEIFEDWAKCLEAIKSRRRVSYKKFDDFQSAKDFISTEPSVQRTLELWKSSIENYLLYNHETTLKAQQNLEPKYVYMDGSFFPGPVESQSAGYGVYFGENDPRNLSERLEMDNLDNFISEVYAAKAALTIIHQDIERYERHELFLMPKYILATDSETVINLLVNYIRSWDDAEYNKRKCGHALRETARLYNTVCDFYSSNVGVFGGHHFQVEWVKGHSGIEGNEMADFLAKAGARRPLGDVNL